MSIFRRIISVFVMAAAIALPAAADMASGPRLVLVISLDQMRPDRLTRDLPGGLGRLVREGFVYTHATLDHAVTTTCPGHVVMSTGVNPSKAGIPSNTYIELATMRDRYCVDDDDEASRVDGASYNRSPRVMHATALGDWLKAASPASKVFSVAGKDRAAITLGGIHPDGAFWYDREAARFTTSG